jgi:hypothetical protein
MIAPCEAFNLSLFVQPQQIGCYPVQYNGYQLLAHGMYGQFLTQYGSPSIATFIAVWSLIWATSKGFDWYFEMKLQKQRMKQLPGVYR